MTEGFFGFRIFDSWTFLGKKILQVFFVWLDLSGDLSRDLFGYSKQSEDLWPRPRVSRPRSPVLIFNALHCMFHKKSVI